RDVALGGTRNTGTRCMSDRFRRRNSYQIHQVLNLTDRCPLVQVCLGGRSLQERSAPTRVKEGLGRSGEQAPSRSTSAICAFRSSGPPLGRSSLGARVGTSATFSPQPERPPESHRAIAVPRYCRAKNPEVVQRIRQTSRTSS